MGAVPFDNEQETDVTMRRFWKYIEVRKKPWNYGEVVLRESADFMNKAGGRHADGAVAGVVRPG